MAQGSTPSMHSAAGPAVRSPERGGSGRPPAAARAPSAASWRLPFFFPSSPRLRTAPPRRSLSSLGSSGPEPRSTLMTSCSSDVTSAAADVQLFQHLDGSLGRGAPQLQRPTEIVRAQHIRAATGHRKFVDPQLSDVRVHLFPPEAGPGEQGQVRVCASHRAGPARTAQHAGGVLANQRAVQSLFVPGPGPKGRRVQNPKGHEDSFTRKRGVTGADGPARPLGSRRGWPSEELLSGPSRFGPDGVGPVK